MQAQPLPIHRSFSRELVELSETSAPSDTCRMKADVDRGLNDHQGCLLGMVPNKKIAQLLLKWCAPTSELLLK